MQKNNVPVAFYWARTL